MATQKPNFKEPKWSSQSITREYNDMWENRIKNLGKYPNPNELPIIIQQMKDTKQIINDFYDEKINFTEQFLDKVSYTYKGNFRSFGRLFPSGIATMLSTSKGITYNDFLNQYESNLSPIRVEEVQQIGIDVKEPEPELDSVASSFESNVLAFTESGQAKARARQDTKRSKIAKKEEQPLQLFQEAYAEPMKLTKLQLSDRFYQVLKQIEDGYVIIPDWFENNIRWVQNGDIPEEEFWKSYNKLEDIGLITTKEIEIEKPLPVEPQVNDIVNFPMVKQTAIDFQIEGSRITGTVILDKISANWNNYYDGRNLVSYFQSSDLADIVLVNKPNIVKFRPSEPPLLPTEKITINESTEGKDKIKVKLFLFTEDNVPVAEPLEFLLQEGEVITAKPKPKRTDFLGLIGSGLAGAIGISLLLSGVKK